MNYNQRQRYRDAAWYSEDAHKTGIIVGGVGGIGSWLTLLLARTGFNPYPYDMDVVEEHNIGGQLFGSGNIGQYKTEAIARIVYQLSDIKINYRTEEYKGSSLSTKYMFSAFDNMKARKIMFENWKKYLSTKSAEDVKDAIFIDGRLQAEQLQIYCVTPDKIAEYEATLFDDSEVADGVCTFKQTSHFASMIASFMVSFFTNHIANVKSNNKARRVPFSHDFYGPLNMVMKEGRAL